MDKSRTSNSNYCCLDAVAKDELRKNLIKQAAPPGVKAHVVPINHMIKLAKIISILEDNVQCFFLKIQKMYLEQ